MTEGQYPELADILTMATDKAMGFMRDPRPGQIPSYNHKRSEFLGDARELGWTETKRQMSDEAFGDDQERFRERESVYKSGHKTWHVDVQIYGIKDQ
jgi:hypothetical protein